MKSNEVYFYVIGYFPGKPKKIIYRKKFNECNLAFEHLNEQEKRNKHLFFVIRPVLENIALTLF